MYNKVSLINKRLSMRKQYVRTKEEEEEGEKEREKVESDGFLTGRSYSRYPAC